VELIQEHIRRVLTYLRLLNDQGFDPSREHLEKFAQNPVPQSAVFQSALFASAGAVFDLVQPRKIRDAEPVVEYLLRLEWVHESAGLSGHLRLTDLGRILLRGLETEAPTDLPEPTVADVVLEPTDPLAWVNLTRVTANAGAGMLVDAYFKAESVPWLVETTTLRRVLVSSRHQSATRDLTRMAVALATVPNAGELEVRSTDAPELHDRCLIGADGGVQLLGSSVNGVGRSMTSVITPDVEVMRFYRDRYEGLWSSATVIVPQQPAVSLGTFQPQASR
jgi:hypothetical protein